MLGVCGYKPVAGHWRQTAAWLQLASFLWAELCITPCLPPPKPLIFQPRTFNSHYPQKRGHSVSFPKLQQKCLADRASTNVMLIGSMMLYVHTDHKKTKNKTNSGSLVTGMEIGNEWVSRSTPVDAEASMDVLYFRVSHQIQTAGNQLGGSSPNKNTDSRKPAMWEQPKYRQQETS